MKRKKQHMRRTASKKRRVSQASRKNVAPRTAEQYFTKSEQFQDRWKSVAHVISKMRADKLSLSQASREFGIDPRTVVRLGGSALRKGINGRYAAKRKDQLLRILAVPTTQGKQEIAVRDSRQASELGKYWAAVQRYLQTGDSSALSKFRNKSIKTADGVQVPLITDLSLLRRLGGAGVVSFESLYGRTA